MIRCAGYLFTALYVLFVRFADLNNFVSQLHDTFFDWILHDDRLAEHCSLYGLSPSGGATCTVAGNQKGLLQLRVLGFGLLEDGDVWIGVFPESEEVFIGGEYPDAGGIGIRSLRGP